MRPIFFIIAAAGALSAMILQSVQSQTRPQRQAAQTSRSSGSDGKARPAADRSADEAAIRKNIARFVKAYNAADAKAIAALFTPDGQVEDENGNVSDGREAIAHAFAEIFAANPKRDLQVSVGSIRFIGTDLAVEVGTTTETVAPNEPPENDRYTVLHIKRNGKWQMALAHDEEGPAPTAHERLRPLGWLVGEWIDDGGSTVVRSSCRWSADGNFLLQDFKLQISGRNAMNVSQRIGWDPVAKRIHSWVFDSEGGYGESEWTREGNGWIIKATGVRAGRHEGIGYEFPETGWA